MPKYHFYKTFFTIKCILENKIIATTFANICVIEYGFINNKFAKIVCQVLEIELQCLIKLKQI